MEYLGFIFIYLAIGAISVAFFKFVEDFFIEMESEVAAWIVFLWPMFWFFFILKLVTRPVFWICEKLFD